jgi:hypothetical protein
VALSDPGLESLAVRRRLLVAVLVLVLAGVGTGTLLLVSSDDSEDPAHRGLGRDLPVLDLSTFRRSGVLAIETGAEAHVYIGPDGSGAYELRLKRYEELLKLKRSRNEELVDGLVRFWNEVRK